MTKSGISLTSTWFVFSFYFQVTCFLFLTYHLLISATQNILFSKESMKYVRRFIEKLQHFETRASAHTVHIHLKSESTKFQEESWFVHHHCFGSRFHPLCHSAHVSFRVLLHHHWLLPHLGNQGEKETNLDHPPWVQTALVGGTIGPRTTPNIPESSAPLQKLTASF